MSEPPAASRDAAPDAPPAPVVRFTPFTPFGQRAVQLGFVSADDLQRALGEQHRRDASGREHQLIGMVLIELGLLSTTQLLAVLKTYEAAAAPPR